MDNLFLQQILFSIYYVPQTFVGIGDTTVEKKKKNPGRYPCPHRAYILMSEGGELNNSARIHMSEFNMAVEEVRREEH